MVLKKANCDELTKALIFCHIQDLLVELYTWLISQGCNDTIIYFELKTNLRNGLYQIFIRTPFESHFVNGWQGLPINWSVLKQKSAYLISQNNLTYHINDSYETLYKVDL